MSKVTFVKVNTANVRVDNSENTERVYDIECNINTSDSGVNSFEAGEVMAGETMMASFSFYGERNLSINFHVADAVTMVNVLNAVNSFMDDTRELVSGTELLNL